MNEVIFEKVFTSEATANIFAAYPLEQWHISRLFDSFL